MDERMRANDGAVDSKGRFWTSALCDPEVTSFAPEGKIIHSLWAALTRYSGSLQTRPGRPVPPHHHRHHHPQRPHLVPRQHDHVLHRHEARQHLRLRLRRGVRRHLQQACLFPAAGRRPRRTHAGRARQLLDCAVGSVEGCQGEPWGIGDGRGAGADAVPDGMFLSCLQARANISRLWSLPARTSTSPARRSKSRTSIQHQPSTTEEYSNATSASRAGRRLRHTSLSR